MCKLASFVVTRDGALWHPSSDSHEDIIKRHKLNDKVTPPDFVRTEVAPKDGKYLSPFAEWEYRVDQDTLPEWYSAAWSEAQCREALPSWKATRPWFFAAMEFVETIKDVRWFQPTEPPLPEWRVFDTLASALASAWDSASLLASCLVVSDLIDPKHLSYARARWDVWVRGYGVACDVDGVLYVYRRPA